jgi:hypothetical protein
VLDTTAEAGTTARALMAAPRKSSKAMKEEKAFRRTMKE